MKPAVLVAPVVWGMLLPIQALAQDDEDPPVETTDETEAATESEGPGFSRVIDDDETIYAIQRKAYLLRNKLELSLMYNTLIGDRFVATENSVAVAGSIAYHLSEAFALEVFGGYFAPTESETTTELLEELRLETEAAKLTQLLWAAGVGVQWSPIYGKLQFAGLSLGNFAFYLGVGGAVGQSRVQCKGTEELDPNQFPGETCRGDETLDVAYEPNTFRAMAVLSGGLRFRFLNWFGMKAEVKDYIFTSRVFRPQSGLTDSVRNNIYFQIGLTFLLGGESN